MNIQLILSPIRLHKREFARPHGLRARLCHAFLVVRVITGVSVYAGVAARSSDRCAGQVLE